MASNSDATVKKKNKPLSKRPMKIPCLALQKPFRLSKADKLNVLREKYESDDVAGRTDRKAEYELTVYENRSFSLREEDRVHTRARVRVEAAFAPHTRPHQFQPTTNTLVYRRPSFNSAVEVDGPVLIDVNDRTPLQPKRRYSKLAKIWGELLNCCSKHRYEFTKDQISWPVAGTLVVRGPEGELEDALISLSIDNMLEDIMHTEAGVGDVYARQCRSNWDDESFRKISKSSTERGQLSHTNVPVTTTVTNSHQQS